MELKHREIRIHWTDPDATDSDTNSDSGPSSRPQLKRVTKTVLIPKSIPNQILKQRQKQKQEQNPESKNPGSRRQPSSKYRGVRKRQSGNWAAEIRNPITGERKWLGTFSSEEEAHLAYQAASKSIEKEKAQIAQGKKGELYQTAAPPNQTATTQCQLCRTSGKQCQTCQKFAQPTPAVTQACKFCLSADQGCKICQMAAMRTREERATETENVTNKEAAVFPPLIKRRKRIETVLCSVISEENQREDVASNKPAVDLVSAADKPTSAVTSAPLMTTGSVLSVNEASAKPAGLMDGLSSELLKQLEGIPEATLGIGDLDSCEDDLIQLDDLPLWTENLDCSDFSFFKF